MALIADLPRNEAGIATALDLLRQRLGPARVETGQALRAQHAHTTTWLRTQPPDAVIFPASTHEVQEIVRICAGHRVPIVAFGTGSSLEGHVNAPAGGISLDFSKMHAILEVHAEDMDAVVQPGVTRKALNTHLRDTGLFFPVDPGADASLGGDGRDARLGHQRGALRDDEGQRSGAEGGAALGRGDGDGRAGAEELGGL